MSVTLPATGSGTATPIVATDDIAGESYQLIKPGFGASGAFVLAVAGAGAVTTGTQRVTLASNDPAVTALEIIDDWDETNRAAVNLIASQAGITGGAGVVAANTPRVTLASDDPAVASLSVMDDWDETNRAAVNIIAGQVGVQGASGVVTALTQRVVLATDVGLPAGTSNIGDVDVLTIAAGDNNIGNVDIVTVPSDPFGANADAASATGSISAKLRFLAATGIAGMTALPAGSNAIGKLAANSGVDIGDVDVTSIAAGTNWIGDVGMQPRTSLGLTTFMASGSDGSTALTSTAQAIKASAGVLYGYYVYNPNVIAQFVHFYNTAQASVSVGTTSPLFTLTVPPLSAANLINPLGITFSNAGWSCAATSTAGGNGAPTTALDLVVWYA